MGSHTSTPGLTRRRLLEGAAAVSVAPALARGAAADEALARRRRRRRSQVAVIGGGMAGLAAAHELAERGFDVVVYERKALGGKARSMGVPGSARDGRRELPGEHGFRFFPGFYHHVPDTMRRIPFAGNANGVWDNLAAASGASFARAGGREDLTVAEPRPFTPTTMLEVLVGAFQQVATLPAHELAFFANRLLVFFTSSDERRLGQWEHTGWWNYVRAEGTSEEYRKMLAIGLTRNLVAAKAEIASTRTIGLMAEAFIYNIMGRGNDGAPDRVLNAPTNEAWIDAWLAHLRSLGVRFRTGEVTGLRLRDGRLAAARVARGVPGRRRLAEVEADWFVLAVPVERALRLLSARLNEADPRLASLRELQTEWMNGIQFYLREQVPVVYGHLSYVDSPWALTSISQAQFWPGRDFARDYGDGSVRDCLSVDVSNWDEPGILYGKPASACTPQEVANEVWAQIKAHLEDTGRQYLPDRLLHSFFLDPAIAYPRARRRARGRRWRAAAPVLSTNSEPLLVNTVGAWEKRPGTETAVPNLFLAGDYVQVNIDLATMEGANESGRRAANAILERSGSQAEPARLYELYRPPEWEQLKLEDAARFRGGQPHVLDS